MSNSNNNRDIKIETEYSNIYRKDPDMKAQFIVENKYG